MDWAFDGGGGILQTPRDNSPVLDFQTLLIGAGGFITNLLIANDGTKIGRTDTYGAYVCTGLGPWRQLLTMNSMPAGDPNIGYLNGSGVCAVGIAPNNSQVLYMVYSGGNSTNAQLYVSFNQGFIWFNTFLYGFLQGNAINWTPNDSTVARSARLKGNYIAVDPANPEVVYVSTPVNGLYQSSQGGFTGQYVAAVGHGILGPTMVQGGGHLIAFDPTSPVVGGKTQGIYVSTYGTGVYHSTDGGTTWTLTTVSGNPTNHNHMICDVNGKVWYVDDTFPPSGSSSLWTYTTATGWVNNPCSPNPPTAGGYAFRVQTIAVNPLNTNQVVAGIDGGQVVPSIDGGFTFNNNLTFNDPQLLGAGDPGWVPNADGVFFSNGNQVYDPSTGVLHMAAGRGTWWSASPGNYAPIANVTNTSWTTHNLGIEQLVPTGFCQPPGGKPCCCVGDKMLFVLPDTSTYPTVNKPFDPPLAGAGNVLGSSVDWASADPNTIVLLANVLSDISSYSHDGGQTFTLFGNTNLNPSSFGIGGSISASTSTNFVWIPSNGGKFIFSTNDTGNTWTQVDIGATGGWGFAFFLCNQVCCADRVLANTFYAYNVAAPTTGIWKSTNGGLNWTRVFTGFLNTSSGGANDGFNGKLRAVQGHAGHIWWATGPSGSATTTHPATGAGFWRSTDGGTTWTQIPNAYEILDVAFGAAAPGASYPAIYVAGWINNMYGCWQSIDNAVTWRYLAQWPLGSFDLIKTVGANPDVFGTMYVGFSGSGFAWRHG